MFPAFFVTLWITVFHSVLVDPTLIASNQCTILGAKGCHRANLQTILVMSTNVYEPLIFAGHILIFEMLM